MNHDQAMALLRELAEQSTTYHKNRIADLMEYIDGLESDLVYYTNYHDEKEGEN